MSRDYGVPPSIKVVMTEVYDADNNGPMFVAVEDVVFNGDWPKGTNFEVIYNGIRQAVCDGTKGEGK